VPQVTNADKNLLVFNKPKARSGYVTGRQSDSFLIVAQTPKHCSEICGVILQNEWDQGFPSLGKFAQIRAIGGLQDLGWVD
jgi:hypothetical protein